MCIYKIFNYISIYFFLYNCSYYCYEKRGRRKKKKEIGETTVMQPRLFLDQGLVENILQFNNIYKFTGKGNKEQTVCFLTYDRKGGVCVDNRIS